MKLSSVLFIGCLISSGNLSAQSNCSSPLSVTVCPTVYLTGQTNAGMLDDAPASYNITGEDLVYEINMTNGAGYLYVSVLNATGSLRLTLLGGCSSGTSSVKTMTAGSRDFTFSTSNSSKSYLWIDAATTVTFNLSIGADTNSTYYNIPNTQGKFAADTGHCAAPMFNSNKSYFGVTYNGVDQTNPMTLSPLYVTGSMCVSIYLKNTTGVEGVKSFKFYFNPTGYSSVTTTSVAGKYNSGNWIASQSGNYWTMIFADSAGKGKGDFTGTPNSCLKYDFCFDIIPVSNDTVKTSVDIWVTSDGFGVGWSGYVSQGCCPSPVPNCLSGATLGSATSPHGFSFGFNDPPGAGLPIELVSFKAKALKNKVQLNWVTAAEVNNNYFTIERSQNFTDWEAVGIVKGAGNSTRFIAYEYIDSKPLPNTSYYRLKQTDFDGAFTYSKAEVVFLAGPDIAVVYPNPAYNYITILSNAESPLEITLYNSQGRKMQSSVIQSNHIEMNVAGFPSGLYYLVIEKEKEVIKKEKINIQH